MTSMDYDQPKKKRKTQTYELDDTVQPTFNCFNENEDMNNYFRPCNIDIDKKSQHNQFVDESKYTCDNNQSNKNKMKQTKSTKLTSFKDIYPNLAHVYKHVNNVVNTAT